MVCVQRNLSECVCVSPVLCAVSRTSGGGQESDSSSDGASPEAGGEKEDKEEEEEEEGDHEPSNTELSSSWSSRGTWGSAVRGQGPSSRAPASSTHRDMVEEKRRGLWRDGDAVDGSRALGVC